MNNLDIQPPYGTSTTSPEVENGNLIIKRAISTAQQAQKIGDRTVLDDIGRDIRRSELQRALNGNSPFSERILKEKNQGHRFNFSMGYLEGACGRAYAPYLDLAMDEEFLAMIKADLEESKKNIIRNEFVKAIKKWGLWPSNYNSLVRECVDFGWCTAVFPDPHSPWWFPVRQRDGLTFGRARNVASKLDVFVWKRSYLIHELYEHVQDEEAAKAAGWEVENVYEALKNAAPDDYVKNRLMGGRQIFEEAVRAAALALSYSQGAKVIETYHVFCRELSGGVSHWIVLNSSSYTKAPESVPPESIKLFYQYDEFPSFDDVVVRFDFEFGDGFWHGSKGLAQKLYNIHKAHDRLFCSGLDQTFRGGLGVLKSNSQKGHESFNVNITSDFVVLPPDYDALQGIKMPTLDQTFFSMDAALLATGTQRGGDVAPEAMGIERPEKTATQANIDQGQKQIVTKTNLKRWLPPLSHVIDTMLKRLVDVENGGEVSKAFVASLLKSGITPDDIQKIQKAEVFHSVEDVFGETKQNVSFISDKYRMDPDVARLELKKKEVGIWLGPQAALELVPGDADQLDSMKASRLQTMEISAILDGNAVPVAPDDLHQVHVATILQYFGDFAQRLTQGQVGTRRSPNQNDITSMAQHADQHIQALANVKGNRPMARQLEMALKDSLSQLQQAQAAHVAQHVAAAAAGMAKGVADSQAGTPPGSEGASLPGSARAQPSPASPVSSPSPEPQSLLSRPIAA